MGRNKLIQIREVGNFENVFINPSEIKGRWRELVFKGGPVVLELACGHGHYTLALADQYKDKNFIGVDKKGNRID